MSPVRASKKCTTGSATKDNDMGSDMEQGPEWQAASENWLKNDSQWQLMAVNDEVHHQLPFVDTVDMIRSEIIYYHQKCSF